MSSIRPPIQDAIHTLGSSIKIDKKSDLAKFLKRADEMVEIQKDIQTKLDAGVDLKYVRSKLN